MNVATTLWRFAVAACVLVFGFALSAHVGSPDTIWEGSAGPWPIRVIIRDPGVIPGLAEIIVHTGAPGVEHITVTAAVWNADGGAPPPDEAKRVPGDSTLWSTHVWFMSATSYGVKVQLSGSKGEGAAVVPFVARATRVTPLPAWLGGVLSALGLLLIAGMATIVMSAMRESTIIGGQQPDPVIRRRAAWGGAFTVALLLVVLWLANGWWSGEADAYAQGVIAAQPFSTIATVNADGSGAKLTLTITDSSWRESVRRSTSGVRRGLWSPLIPEHGHLMHAFLVSDGGDGFAHLHPIAIDSTRFTTNLPPLPAGHYHIFADIVHESGWSQTLTASVTLPPRITTWSPGDNEDSWTVSSVTGDSIVDIGDGLKLLREQSTTPLVSGNDVTLHFRVLNADGSTASVEPYLGMAGHLALVRDSTVYMHLHPSGTASIAATEILRARLKVTENDSTHQMGAMSLPGELHFPYRFPQAGNYRIWVQVRLRGVIRTGGFRVVVKSEE